MELFLGTKICNPREIFYRVIFTEIAFSHKVFVAILVFKIDILPQQN